jgi:hypothetical protein
MLHRPTAAVLVENFAARGIRDANCRRAIDGFRLAPTPRVMGVTGRQPVTHADMSGLSVYIR